MIDLSTESKSPHLLPNHMIVIPSIRGESTCINVVKDSRQILIGFQCDFSKRNPGLNVIASITLDEQIEETLVQISPDFRSCGHNSKITCISASNNIFASLDSTNMLLIHSLYNGSTLNYIKLDGPFNTLVSMDYDALNIHSIF